MGWNIIKEIFENDCSLFHQALIAFQFGELYHGLDAGAMNFHFMSVFFR
jgi:hypothetical protein